MKTLEVSFLLNMKESDMMASTLFGTEAGCQWPSGELYKTWYADGRHYSAVITYREQRVRIISVRRARTEEVAIYEG